MFMCIHGHTGLCRASLYSFALDIHTGIHCLIIKMSSLSSSCLNAVITDMSELFLYHAVEIFILIWCTM